MRAQAGSPAGFRRSPPPVTSGRSSAAWTRRDQTGAIRRSTTTTTAEHHLHGPLDVPLLGRRPAQGRDLHHPHRARPRRRRRRRTTGSMPARAVKGTLPNGCLPAVQADPDKDGVYGAADLCPALDGQGAFNGCPGGIIPEIIKPPENKTLVATLLTKSGTAFKRASLAKGAPVKFECTVDSAANGTLSITEEGRQEAQDQDEEEAEDGWHRQRQGPVQGRRRRQPEAQARCGRTRRRSRRPRRPSRPRSRSS